MEEDNQLVEEIIRRFSEESYVRYYKNRVEFSETIENIMPGLTVIYVGQLTSCREKVVRERENVKNVETYRQYVWRPALLIGDALEEEVKRVLPLSRPYIAYRILENWLIVGSADGMYNGIPVEVKYRTRDCRVTPSAVMQARLYAWLYRTDNAIIIVVSPDCVKAYRVEPCTDSEVKTYITAWPSPRWPHECAHCPYSRDCRFRVNQTLDKYFVEL